MIYTSKTVSTYMDLELIIDHTGLQQSVSAEGIGKLYEHTSWDKIVDSMLTEGNYECQNVTKPNNADMAETLELCENALADALATFKKRKDFMLTLAEAELEWFDAGIFCENDLHPTLFILAGPPASGKTTFRESARLISRYSANIVSSDDSIDRMARANHCTYDDVFNLPEHKDELRHIMDRKIWTEAADHAIEHSNSVVWDQTNLTPKSRHAIIAKFRDAGYRIVGINFLATLADCHLRIANREKNHPGKTIPSDIVANMVNRFEPITTAEAPTIINIDIGAGTVELLS